MSDSDEEYNPAAGAAKKPLPLQAAATAAAAPSAPGPPAPTGPTRDLASGAPPFVACGPGTAMAHAALKAHSKPARCVAVDPAGTHLVSGGGDGQLCMWTLPQVLAAAPASRLDAVGVTRSIEPFPSRVSGHQAVSACTWLADGQHFVACEDGPTALVVTRGGKTLDQTMRGNRQATDICGTKGHNRSITCCAAAPTGNRFATSGEDGSVRTWTADTAADGSTYCAKHGSGQLMDTVAVRAVAFSPRDPAIVCSGGVDGAVQLWDTRRAYRPGAAALALSLPAAAQEATSMDTWTGSKGRPAVVALAFPGAGDDRLAVRTPGSALLFDLRRPQAPAAAARAALPAHYLGASMTTSALGLARRPALVTVTSRLGVGLDGAAVCGGHVVALSPDTLELVAAACVDERHDALAAAVDAEGSHCYVALSSGDVAATSVRLGLAGDTSDWASALRCRVTRGARTDKRARSDSDSD